MGIATARTGYITHAIGIIRRAAGPALWKGCPRVATDVGLVSIRVANLKMALEQRVVTVFILATQRAEMEIVSRTVRVSCKIHLFLTMWSMRLSVTRKGITLSAALAAETDHRTQCVGRCPYQEFVCSRTSATNRCTLEKELTKGTGKCRLFTFDLNQIWP